MDDFLKILDNILDEFLILLMAIQYVLLKITQDTQFLGDEFFLRKLYALTGFDNEKNA